MGALLESNIVTVPAGAKTVALVDAVEQREILADLDRLRARVAKLEGERRKIPGAIIDAIFVENANPVQVWRKHRKMTGAVLAEQAGISRSYLSDIETGRKPIMKVAVGSISAIADALDIDIEDLLPPDD